MVHQPNSRTMDRAGTLRDAFKTEMAVINKNTMERVQGQVLTNVIFDAKAHNTIQC